MMYPVYPVFAFALAAASLPSAASADLPLAAPAAAMPAVSGEPEVFSHAGLDADRRRAIDEGRVHVVYATATWCPPCKQMKKTTWVDDGVVAWLDANAVVTPLDVDEHQSDAQRYRVRAMPTMMIFQGSAEVSRTVGYKSATDFRAWLETSTGRGIPAPGAEAANDTAAEGAPAERASRATVQQKIVQAHDAVTNGRYDEATDVYLWLWNSVSGDRAADSLRQDMLAPQIAGLIEQHEPARETFAKRRDSLGSPIPAKDASITQVIDWIVLNSVVGEPERTLEWVDTAIEDRVLLRQLRKNQERVWHTLVDAERWDDASTVVSNPFERARWHLMQLKIAQRTSGESGIDDATLSILADLHTIALVSGRSGAAERVSTLVLRTEDTPRVRRALVARAIEADQTKPALAELLEGDESDEAYGLLSQLDS